MLLLHFTFTFLISYYMSLNNIYSFSLHFSPLILSDYYFFFFFFNDPPPPEISPLPLHDALPISADLPQLGGLFLGNLHDPLLAGALKLPARLHDEPPRFQHAPRLERVQRFDQQRADALDFTREALVTKSIHGGLILTDRNRLGFDALGAGLDLLAIHVRDRPHQLLHRGDEGTGIHAVTKHHNLRGCQPACASRPDLYIDYHFVQGSTRGSRHSIGTSHVGLDRKGFTNHMIQPRENCMEKTILSGT